MRHGLEAAGDAMSRKTASYRMLPLILATIFAVACSAYIYFSSPINHGRMAGVLRTAEGLTILGWAAFACSMAVTTLALIYAMRALTGLPALKSDGETLSVYVFPFRRIPLSEIDRIVLKTNDVEIYDHRGKKRKINTRLANEPEEFFRGIGLRVYQ